MRSLITAVTVVSSVEETKLRMDFLMKRLKASGKLRQNLFNLPRHHTDSLKFYLIKQKIKHFVVAFPFTHILVDVFMHFKKYSWYSVYSKTLFLLPIYKTRTEATKKNPKKNWIWQFVFLCLYLWIFFELVHFPCKSTTVALIKWHFLYTF